MSTSSFNVHQVTAIRIEHVEYKGRKWSRVIFDSTDDKPLEISVFAAEGVEEFLYPDVPAAEPEPDEMIYSEWRGGGWSARERQEIREAGRGHLLP